MRITYNVVSNLKFIRADETAFSCDVKFDHAPFSLPFIATLESTAEYSVDLYKRGIIGEFGLIAPCDQNGIIVPNKITRRQAALQLLTDGMITSDESLAMAATATPPAVIANLINQMANEERNMVLIGFAAVQYERSNSTFNGLIELLEKLIQDIDAFFQKASLI